MTHSAIVPQILAVAASSGLTAIKWQRRGSAPKGYINGMAVAFGRCYCKLKAGDAAALDMARPDTGNPRRDALTHYRAEFTARGMDNSRGGADTLRHLFVLMTGLGMRESSGQYGEGRDMSAKNASSNTAEAGLFQVSYNSHTASPLLDRLFDQYRGSRDFLDIFNRGVAARQASLSNWGNGAGREFQELTKSCPAFAVEYAAVALRHLRTHWGPINRKAAEVHGECDALYRLIQKLIDNSAITRV